MAALVFAALTHCRAFFIGHHRLGLEVAALRQQLVVFNSLVLAKILPLMIRQRREWSGLTASPPFAICELNESELVRASYGQQPQTKGVH